MIMDIALIRFSCSERNITNMVLPIEIKNLNN